MTGYIQRFPSAEIIREVFDPPVELGDYLLVMRLAYGGSAEIFAALNKAGNLIALKLLHSHLSAEEQAVQNFTREAELWKRFSDPIFPNYHKSFEIGGRLCHEMELVEGFDLAFLRSETLRKNVKITERGALSLCIVILDALSRLNEKNDMFIHRDLSPHNILIDANGIVRIADLGIAKDIESQSATKTGEVKGKIAYMSPEQAAGEKLTPASDIFSTGAVLFELIMGERLYPESGAVGWQKALSGAHNAEERLKTLGVMPQIINVLLHMLAKEPSARPSAKEALFMVDLIAVNCGYTLDVSGVKEAFVSPIADLFSAFTRSLEPFRHGFSGASRGEAKAIAKRKKMLLAATIIFSLVTILALALHRVYLPLSKLEAMPVLTNPDAENIYRGK